MMKKYIVTIFVLIAVCLSPAIANYNSTVLLYLPMNGTGGSTTFYDLSQYSRVVTAGNLTNISTSSPKFGSGSATFDFGAKSFLSIPASADFGFGTDNFSVVAQVYPAVFDSAHSIAIFGQYDDDNNRQQMVWSTGGGLYYYVKSGGVNIAYVQATGIYPALNQWSEYRVVRNGNVIKLYVNGTDVTTSGSAVTGSVPTLTSPVTIGRVKIPGGSLVSTQGNLDEVVFTRYTNLQRENVQITELVKNPLAVFTANATSGIYPTTIQFTDYSDGGYENKWASATTSASWPARSHHGMTTFNNKLWIYGGTNDSVGTLLDYTVFNDSWYSTDGSSWVSAGIAEWPSRQYFAAVVYNNSMWVIGGGEYISGNVISVNDTWRSSSDGTTWTKTTSGASWEARRGLSAFVLNGKLWITGGASGDLGTTGVATKYYNDTWYTTDGITWAQAATAPWEARRGQAVVVINNTAYMYGGRSGVPAKTSPINYNDVWATTDGSSWTQVSSSSLWSKRGDFASAGFSGKLWVFGGYDSSTLFNDTYSSSNGVTWIKDPQIIPWVVREYFSASERNGTLYFSGGDTTSDTYLKDVWTTNNNILSYQWDFNDGNTSHEQNPINTFSGVADRIINLTITNPTGYSSYYMHIVTTSPFPPSASFVSSTNPSSSGSSVTFTDTSTGSPSTWNWSFDNRTSWSNGTTQNPTHTFTLAGAYNVTLVCNNTYGISDPYDLTQIVANLTGDNYQDIVMSPRFSFTIHITDKDNGLPIPVVATITDTANSQVNTTVAGTTTLFEDYSIIVGTISADGYQSKSFTAVVDSNIEATYQLTKSSSGSRTTWYTPMHVTFKFSDQNANPISSMYVSVTPVNITTPSDWTQILIGIDPSVNINGTTISGFTASDGTWAAPMLQDILYEVAVSKPSSGISLNWSLHPEVADYAYTIPVGLAPVPTLASNVISYSLGNATINSTAEFINMTYVDGTAGTTYLLFAVYDGNNTLIYSQAYSGVSANSQAYSLQLPHPGSAAYTYGIFASQSQYGWINSTKTLTFRDYVGILDDSPGWVEFWIACCLIVVLAAGFSLFSVRFAMVVIPIFAFYLQYGLGWFDIGIGGSVTYGFIMVIGILRYIRESENKIT